MFDTDNDKDSPPRVPSRRGMTSRSSLPDGDDSRNHPKVSEMYKRRIAKSKEHVERLQSSLPSLQTKQTDCNGRMTVLRKQMTLLQEQMAATQEQMTSVSNDLDHTRKDIDVFTGNLRYLHKKLEDHESAQKAVPDQMGQMSPHVHPSSSTSSQPPSSRSTQDHLVNSRDPPSP